MLVKRTSTLPNIFDELFNDLAIRTNDTLKKFQPAVNVKENEKNYELYLAAPGLNKDDFQIDVHDDVLTIAVEKEVNNKQDNEDHFTLREYSYQSFKRTFNLPSEQIDAESIKAKYENGELLVNIPKKEIIEPKPKLIEVK